MGQMITDMRSSFNGGELSNRMEGRTDTAIYRIAASTIENMVIAVEGPLVKAPGFEMIAPALVDASYISRFVFSRTQSYILEWGGLALRFYTNGGRIETTPGVPYALETPYSAAEAREISRQQSYDRQYLAHRAHPPAALKRTAAETFVLELLELVNGPFEDVNTNEALTVTSNATTGNVVLSASGAIFGVGDEGSLFRLEAKDYSDIRAWQPGIKGHAVGDKRRSDGKVYEVDAVFDVEGITGTLQPTHEQGSEWDGAGPGQDINNKGPYGVRWKYLHDRFGIVRLTGVTSPSTATGVVIRRLPSSVTSVASRRWAFSAFSKRRGWPNVVSIWNQRLIFIKDFDIYGSVVGDYLNFQQFTSAGLVAADLAFHYRLAASDPILWAQAADRLVVGTASGIYPIGALNNAAAPGPGNIGISRPTFYGVEPVPPLQIGTLIQFVERGGRKLREGQYDFQRDAIVANNVNVWARHMSKGGFRQLAYLSASEELIVAVRGDGQLAYRSYSPEQDVKGWTRRQHGGGGRFVSAEAIPSEDGSEDELWGLIDTDGFKSVERMTRFWDEDEDQAADAFFVDSGATVYREVATAQVTGLTWLGGKGVAVLADGAVVAGATVSFEGVLTLPYAAHRVTVGYGYTARLVSLRVEADTRSGTLQGKLKKLVNAIIRLVTTGAGLRAGTAGGTLYDIVKRDPSDAMDAPVPLFTGQSDNVRIGDSYDRDGRFELEHSDPTPWILTAVMPRFEVNDQ